ncbi:response regulator transcription factor [Vagococcus vulneris]|uniref:DNA-binding response regulator n=1 Tax=Vagococcus vulneris TaxID=1977869 RepID=A0A429ZUP8_9ENTE|nr:response regulator transcription factor [Vagococcus vulneris]RST97360.1 DNA-binding response regulator [Vagococcus vulneris]
MTILIIEDNSTLRKLLADYLKQQGYLVLEAESGESGLGLWKSQVIDLILLDIMLPGIDGFTVCQTIRQTSMIPIIMITAKSEDHDKILGLDVGADDYIVKPFSNKEMLARIHAIMRRVEFTNSADKKLILKNLNMNYSAHQVYLNTLPIHLTQKEFDLLYLFITHPNQLFSRDQLLDAVWGMDYFGDFRTVDSHIKRLREKLKQSDKQTYNWAIKTIWGKGYLFEVTRL